MIRAIVLPAALVVATALFLAGCGNGVKADPKAEAPPPTTIEQEPDVSIVQVKQPEQFPLATAEPHSTAPELKVTGVVSADVARSVPVISLASGRVVEIRARLGDEVKKGQLLMRVQSADISGAFSEHRKAQADEVLARAQFDRSQLLYDKGAVAKKDLEVAQDTLDKAKVDVETAAERLRVLGVDSNHPSAVVDIFAPAAGVIIEQNVTAAAGVKTLDNSPNLFTIADLSEIWILCDVYENDLASVRLGEVAEVRLNAYPGSVFQGRVSNIGPILDPAIRAAKVRLEMHNPGMMRIGMFVSATFRGSKKETRVSVPASAVLHLHDRDWVYVPAGDKKFQRVGVVAGIMLPGNMQEIVSGLQPNQQVVAKALVLQNTVEQ